MSGHAAEAAVGPLDPLTRLAIAHGTDKWGAHFYTPVYHRLFSHWRDKPVRLLEIGIGGYGYHRVGGASLRMWADYFPHGHIVGIDIEPKRLPPDPRITTLTGSQSDGEFLARVCREHGPFDIVIDDGSHRAEDVVASFHGLFPRLADGGIYVIEDVQDAFHPRWDGAADGGATVALATALLLAVNHAELRAIHPGLPMSGVSTHVRSVHAYHNLFVVEKGDDSEPSTFDYQRDSPSAHFALETIQEEMAHAPTTDGIANLVRLHLLRRETGDARGVVDEGLARWPDAASLLAVALTVARREGDFVAWLRHAERLLAIEPDNDELRQSFEVTKRLVKER